MGGRWELWWTAALQVQMNPAGLETRAIYLMTSSLLTWFYINKVCTNRTAVRRLLITVFSTLSGLCPDWETWDPVKPVENATEAMQLADDWLGIPQVKLN